MQSSTTCPTQSVFSTSLFLSLRCFCSLPHSPTCMSPYYCQLFIVSPFLNLPTFPLPHSIYFWFSFLLLLFLHPATSHSSPVSHYSGWNNSLSSLQTTTIRFRRCIVKNSKIWFLCQPKVNVVSLLVINLKKVNTFILIWAIIKIWVQVCSLGRQLLSNSL